MGERDLNWPRSRVLSIYCAAAKVGYLSGLQLHDYGAGSSPEAAVEVEMRFGRRGENLPEVFPLGV
jgi:hypothetical protein